VDALFGSKSLTPLGERLVELTGERVSRWQDEPGD
jgi:hypothetical protein